MAEKTRTEDTIEENDAPVLISVDGAIATVTLNNPRKRNALSLPMWEALRDSMLALSRTDGLRCVVLRGAGDEAFAAGADITEFESVRSDPKQARAYDAVLREALAAIYDCVHPTVAMIKGACVGGGLEVAVQCDLRISGRSGKFGAPIKALGLAMTSPEIEGIRRLVGSAVTLEILLEGRIMGAEEACAKGLVTRVVDDVQVEEEAYATARRIAEGAPLTARWHKQFVHRLDGGSVLKPGEIEEGYFYFDTADFKEGVSAFLSKRKPVFRGK
ncbi:MAG: enoyl-CoA hydratase-related protein [Rhodospirillales bacterium]|nr:enoyl-CoA hydratase-related protein [Rhodospirillales bacterium]MCW8861303.1 enoyl-CoA hydratase-related protein [Rhodospirillales bacterium]MCW8952419.1 enoyl-CoA hydratase-related protein [Rhodospirillales bacterium]MCW8969627.1 enoyl-CoA hydratase-related protein [Rhodospirillales bacterium]MCW9001670.1 enoyl-CoA hydratase-related protein [Rhodospirillales bacterium]